jgi:cysteine desulfurase / selenocysteine lyase
MPAPVPEPVAAPAHWRAAFPVFAQEPELAYLDSGATALKPRQVVDVIAQAYAYDYASVHRGVYQRSSQMTERYEAARARVARFLNARSAQEVVFVRGATEAINLVASSWGTHTLQPGDEIILSVLEHHANIVPWQVLAQKVGACLRVIPIDAQGELDYTAFEAMLSPRTRLVAITHLSNVLGTVIDIARITKAAHSSGARVLVDGCQAAPRMAVDVQALGVDFYTFSAHKLYGPTGIGVLWARGDILADMQPYQTGGAMIETVRFEQTTYAPPPQRFEAGTPHSVGALGLHAALDFIDTLGLSAIAAHEQALVREARAILAGFNSVRLLGPALGHGLLSFTIEGVHPHDIGTILDENKVCVRAGHHCAQPLMAHLGVNATVRVSFGVYNTHADLARLAKGIESVLRIFA